MWYLFLLNLNIWSNCTYRWLSARRSISIATAVLALAPDICFTQYSYLQVMLCRLLCAMPLLNGLCYNSSQSQPNILPKVLCWQPLNVCNADLLMIRVLCNQRGHHHMKPRTVCIVIVTFYKPCGFVSLLLWNIPLKRSSKIEIHKQYLWGALCYYYWCNVCWNCFDTKFSMIIDMVNGTVASSQLTDFINHIYIYI